MKTLKSILLLVSFAVIACNKTETIENKTIKTETIIDKDKKDVETVVKNMYRWHESYNDTGAFRTFKKDSMIVGLDHISQSLYTKRLLESGFFATEFIKNMGLIFNKQDELLRSGKVEWLDGDMTPFNGDMDAWCNCQDLPTDNDPFGQINISFTKINQNEASIIWKWNVTKDVDPSWAEPEYAIRLVKEDNKWKIAWMEGWDYEVNTKSEY